MSATFYLAPPDEDFVQCPYNISHCVRNVKFVTHLAKCRASYIKQLKKEGKTPCIVTCRFNFAHQVPDKEIDVHEARCVNRYSIVVPHIVGRGTADEFRNTHSNSSSNKVKEEVIVISDSDDEQPPSPPAKKNRETKSPPPPPQQHHQTNINSKTSPNHKHDNQSRSSTKSTNNDRGHHHKSRGRCISSSPSSSLSSFSASSADLPAPFQIKKEPSSRSKSKSRSRKSSNSSRHRHCHRVSSRDDSNGGGSGSDYEFDDRCRSVNRDARQLGQLESRRRSSTSSKHSRRSLAPGLGSATVPALPKSAVRPPYQEQNYTKFQPSSTFKPSTPSLNSNSNKSYFQYQKNKYKKVTSPSPTLVQPQAQQALPKVHLTTDGLGGENWEEDAREGYEPGYDPNVKLNPDCILYNPVGLKKKADRKKIHRKKALKKFEHETGYHSPLPSHYPPGMRAFYPPSPRMPPGSHYTNTAIYAPPGMVPMYPPPPPPHWYPGMYPPTPMHHHPGPAMYAHHQCVGGGGMMLRLYSPGMAQTFAATAAVPTAATYDPPPGTAPSSPGAGPMPVIRRDPDEPYEDGELVEEEEVEEPPPPGTPSPDNHVTRSTIGDGGRAKDMDVEEDVDFKIKIVMLPTEEVEEEEEVEEIEDYDWVEED